MTYVSRALPVGRSSLPRLIAMPIGPDYVVEVRVAPRPGRPSAEIDGGLVRIRVTGALVDGRATAATRRTLVTALGVPRTSVALTIGGCSRTKHFRIGGPDCSEVWLHPAS